VDHHNAVEPVSSFFEKKVKIRRAIEAEGIPYTYISSNSFAGHFLPNLLQQNVTAPPRDEVVILGDGNIKGNIQQIKIDLKYIFRLHHLTFFFCSCKKNYFSFNKICCFIFVAFQIMFFI